jgi:hypothetical protein
MSMSIIPEKFRTKRQIFMKWYEHHATESHPMFSFLNLLLSINLYFPGIHNSHILNTLSTTGLVPRF